MSVDTEVKEKVERWQTKVTSLKDGIAHIYKTKEFSDVRFVVEGDNEFEAHRLIMAARCSEFAKTILDPNSPPIIDICDDITVKGFEVFLRYIYTDLLGTKDEEAVLDGYRTARLYGQKSLQLKCEERMESWIISCDNVCSFLNQASDIDSLRTRCFHFLQNNAMEVLNSDGFLEASFETLRIIIQSDKLTKIPVYERLRHVMRWGAHQFPEPVDYKLVRERLLENDRPILGLLEIEKLSATELAKVIAEYKNLLKPEEVMAFMMNTSAPGSMPLPDWCLKDNEV